MNERLNSKKNRNLVAVGLAGLALGAGAAEANSTPDSRSPAEPKVLSKGSNIAQVRMLSPNPDKNTSIDLTPKSQKDTEDLAVIYDKNASDAFVSSIGEPEAGDSVGFIIESTIGKTAIKLVYFKPKTGKIDLLSKALLVKHSQNIYKYVDQTHTSESYTASISPQAKTHGVVVSFDHTH